MAFGRLVSRQGTFSVLLTLSLLASGAATLAAQAPPPDHWQKAVALSRAKDWAGVISEVTLVIEKQPQHSTAYFMRANAYRSLKQYDRAISDYTSMMAVRRDDKRFVRQMYTERAKTHRLAGDLAKAVADQTVAARMEREDAPAGQKYQGFELLPLAKLQVQAKDFTAAIDTCLQKQAINQEPEVFHGLGVAYLGARQFEEAVKVFDAHAKSSWYGDGANWNVRGRAKAYLEWGKLESARMDFDHYFDRFDAKGDLARKPDVYADLVKLQALQDGGRKKEVPPLAAGLQVAPVAVPEPASTTPLPEKPEPSTTAVQVAEPIQKARSTSAKKGKGHGDPIGLLPERDRAWTPPSVAKPQVALEGVPLDLQSPLEIGNLTLDQYRRVVGAAREALRLLQGQLSKEETKRHDQKWEALAQVPSAAAVAYLNRLNPLLTDLLSLRGAIVSTSQQFDAAWLEGTEAAGYGNGAGAREAFALAGHYKTQLQAMNARLAKLLGQAEALGDPPDASLEQAQAALHHDDALAAAHRLHGGSGKGRSPAAAPAQGPVAAAAPEPASEEEADASSPAVPAPPAAPGVWVLRQVERYKHSFIDEAIMDAEQRSTRKWEWKDRSFSWEVHNPKPQYSNSNGKAHLRWSPPAQVIRDGKLEIPYELFREGGQWYCAQASLRLYSSPLLALNRNRNPVQGVGNSDYYYTPTKFPETPGPGDIAPRKPPFFWGISSRGLKAADPAHGCVNDMNSGVLTVAFPVRVYPGRIYEFVLESNVGDMLVFDERYVYEYFVGEPPQAASTDLPEAGDEEAIALHQAIIAVLERTVAEEEKALASPGSDDRRKALDFRVKTLKADIQAERDLIQSIQTGELIHTRTEFDDYLRDQFVANIRSNQLRMEAAQRGFAEAQRIAALLPPGEAEEARKFIERQLGPAVLAKGDLDSIRKVSGALANKVVGYAQGAEARKEIASADRALLLLGGLQEAGNIAATIAFGQGGGSAFAGVTGYLSGGPVEAVRSAGMMYSLPSMVAVSAFDGYEKGGFLAQAGVVGALEKGAETLLLGKLFEYGLQYAGHATGTLERPAVREELVERLREFRNKESLLGGMKFDVTAFRQEMTTGRTLVDDLLKVENQIQAAKNAAPEELRRLQEQARAKAVEINASFHAKNYLKGVGGEAEKLASARIAEVYKEVDTRFRRSLEEAGWDTRYLKIKEFRNASSKGKIGMDRDFGVVEDEVTMYLKNGRESSVFQLQKDGQAAYRKAYEDVTKQSYERSFQEFTTRAHSESFRDVGVLNDLRKDFNVKKLSGMWGEQTGRTLEFKGLHMLNDPKLQGHLSTIERYMEASRGLGKEIDSKLIPFLQNAKPVPGLDLAKIQAAQQHFAGLKVIIDDLTLYRINPMEASQRIRALTGGRDLPQVLDQVRNLTETLFKFGAVGR